MVIYELQLFQVFINNSTMTMNDLNLKLLFKILRMEQTEQIFTKVTRHQKGSWLFNKRETTKEISLTLKWLKTEVTNQAGKF